MNCPCCGSETNRAESLLGTLGIMEWWRCRWCGGQWSRDLRKRAARKKKD